MIPLFFHCMGAGSLVWFTVEELHDAAGGIRIETLTRSQTGVRPMHHLFAGTLWDEVCGKQSGLLRTEGVKKLPCLIDKKNPETPPPAGDYFIWEGNFCPFDLVNILCKKKDDLLGRQIRPGRFLLGLEALLLGGTKE